jgi:hypothetical protein
MQTKLITRPKFANKFFLSLAWAVATLETTCLHCKLFINRSMTVTNVKRIEIKVEHTQKDYLSSFKTSKFFVVNETSS